MPKYISRSTGEIVYPDQIRSGEISDVVEVDQYPPQPTGRQNEDRVPVMPAWVGESDEGREVRSMTPNPFTKWFAVCHALLVLAVIGGLVLGSSSVSFLDNGAGVFAMTIVGGVAGALTMVPLYILTQIGSTVWQLKEEVRRSR